MRSFWRFVRTVFSNWASGITGGASAPFAIGSIFVGPVLLKTLFGLFAIACFVFAAYRVWLKEHNELEAMRISKPTIEFGDELEYDWESFVYRLRITNTNILGSLAEVSARIEEVVMDGHSYRESYRLPVRLQWMHHPDRESISLGSEKVDVMFVTGGVFNLAGVTFHEFFIHPSDGKNVSCLLAVYGTDNQPLATIWCHFDWGTKSGLTTSVLNSLDEKREGA